MLDSDAPTNGATTPESQEPTTAQPARRRRRAASRPAGPPKAIEQPPAPAEIAPPAVEPESVEAEWSEVVAEAAWVETVPGAEPFTEPVPADEVQVIEAAIDAEAEEEMDGEVPGQDPQAQETPEVPTADDVEEPGAEESAAAESSADEASADEAPVEQEPAEATSGEEDSTEGAAGDESAEEATAAEAPAEEAPAKPARRRPSRRRGRKADAEPEASDASADGDAVAQELAQLSAEHAGDGAGESDGEHRDVSAALDDLAAAIGGTAPASDDQADGDAEGAEDQAEDNGDGEDSGDDDSTPRRRRRRRGGRRRRRGSDSEDAGDDDSDDDDSDESGDADGDDQTEGEDGGEGSGDESGESSPSGRRRRRRRRRGEDTSTEGETEDGVDVVVKVREPRSSRSKSVNDEVTGIEGSTRMEAKRQRRREGRAAGRRRAPILSEAEFLARREAVERQMLIRQADDYTQIAVMEDGVLVEHYVDRDSAASMIGNIYLGRVQNVLPSMEAAFIDIGRGRNAVLYAGEVDWDTFGVTGDDRKVEKVLKSGQAVLVQVTKDPIGAKGARLTAHISIPGRYVVYCPGGQLSGISRKLPENERARLKGILDDAVGSEASVIVRTAAEGAAEEELVRDVNRLKAQWEVIEKKVKQGNAPQQLYAEPDLTVRIVRDLFTEDFSSLIVDGNGQGEDAWETMEAYVTHVAPHLAERLRRWDRASEGDVFDKFRVHEQVAKALERKVHLPSGGSLIIDRTEAMTVIDVNTGKFTGSQGNLEATVTSNNLEAAEEIVRQLRLRDIGGIIVIDFIDMVLPANRELLLRRLVECLGRDRTRHQVAEVTSLGLVQMTRKRIGTGLAEAFTVSCETCNGRGYHVHDAPVASQGPADGGDRDGGGRRGSRSRGGRSRGGKSDNGGSSNGNGSSTGSNGNGSNGNGHGHSNGSNGGSGARPDAQGSDGAPANDAQPENTTPSGAAETDAGQHEPVVAPHE